MVSVFCTDEFHWIDAESLELAVKVCTLEFGMLRECGHRPTAEFEHAREICAFEFVSHISEVLVEVEHEAQGRNFHNGNTSLGLGGCRNAGVNDTVLGVVLSRQGLSLAGCDGLTLDRGGVGFLDAVPLFEHALAGF